MQVDKTCKLTQTHQKNGRNCIVGPFGGPLMHVTFGALFETQHGREGMPHACQRTSFRCDFDDAVDETPQTSYTGQGVATRVS